jgi:cytochrome c peroxidase
VKRIATTVTAGLAAVVAAVVALMFLHRSEFDWKLPEGMPSPPAPADNPMSEVKAELGRRLFYDTRLSVNGTMSCASCHRQELAFTDARARSVGATGEVHPRGSMTLVNAAYASRLMWSNPLQDSLEVQALTPMFGEDPIEMGMAGREPQILELLQADAYYRETFPSVFPDDADPYSILNLVRAVSGFVRSIVSFDAPYDRYLRGDEDAMSAAAQRGMTLFFSERLECFHCHGGFNFTDSSTHADAVVAPFGFHNTGLYNIGGTGAYPPDNTGLYDLTGERRDMGRFKAPTLRNIAVTAPYMHDGSIETLSEVIDHYQRGGRLVAEGPYAGDGNRTPYKSEFIRGFDLSELERADLIAFLESLTDESVLEDPRYGDPCLPTANAAENCVSRQEK